MKADPLETIPAQAPQGTEAVNSRQEEAAKAAGTSF